MMESRLRVVELISVSMVRHRGFPILLTQSENTPPENMLMNFWDILRFPLIILDSLTCNHSAYIKVYDVVKTIRCVFCLKVDMPILTCIFFTFNWLTLTSEMRFWSFTLRYLLVYSSEAKESMHPWGWGYYENT